MNRRELCGLLETSGIPVAHRTWGEAEPPPLPYIIYYSTGREGWNADNSNYLDVTDWVVEFYSAVKDDDGERAVESALEGAGIIYAKNEVGAVDDGFMAAYYFQTCE